MERFLSVSDAVSSIPGTVNSKTGVGLEEKQKRDLCSLAVVLGGP